MKCTCLSQEGPFRSRCHGALWANDQGIFMFGGQDQGMNYFNDMWLFNTTTSHWQQCHTQYAPEPRKSCASWQGIDGNFYVFGGLGYAEGALNYLNDMWCFDPRTYQWNLLTTQGFTPMGRQECQVWQDDLGDVYIHGGFGVDGIYHDFWRFCRQRMTWIPMPPCPFACYGGASWTLENKLYLCGGLGLGNEQNNFCVYDPYYEQWQFLDNFPFNIYHPLCWVDQGCLNLWSGLVPIKRNTMDCPQSGWCFDTAQEGWKDLALNEWMLPECYGTSVCMQKNQVFIFSGSTSKGIPLDGLWGITLGPQHAYPLQQTPNNSRSSMHVQL